jgi:pimeloyl-ACP methyl ester carboxylesterase
LEPAPANGVRSTTHGPAVHENAADARIERYRHAEATLWKHYGLEPTEHFIDLQSPGVRVRVQVVGSGTPILFIHGGVWPGAAFASLIRELRGFRCVILDRPGCGLSSAIDYSKDAYKTLIAQLLTAVLDAIGIERTHVVGQEVGAAWALALATAHPTRVDRLVLTGAAPLLHEQPVPTFIKVLASPIGGLWATLRGAEGDPG